ENQDAPEVDQFALKRSLLKGTGHTTNSRPIWPDRKNPQTGRPLFVYVADATSRQRIRWYARMASGTRKPISINVFRTRSVAEMLNPSETKEDKSNRLTSGRMFKTRRRNQRKTSS